MDQVLLEMLEIYQPDGTDWMDYPETHKSHYTYHHILEKRYGGKRTLDNGAIITEIAHQYLNYLDYEYNKIYRELNGLFLELNRTEAPPTDDYYEEVNGVLRLVPTWEMKRVRKKGRS